MPQEEVAGIKQVFHMMDTDKNGNLTFEELKDGLHMIGQPVADPEVQMLMDAVSLLFIINLLNSGLHYFLHGFTCKWYQIYFPCVILVPCKSPFDCS